MWERQNLEAELASAEANRDLLRRVVNQCALIPHRDELTPDQLWQEHLARVNTMLWEFRIDELRKELNELEELL